MRYDPTKPHRQMITDMVSQTHTAEQKRIGRYIVTDRGNFYEISHPDGIGSKGVLHWRARTFENAATDAWAMNDNDILTINARPTEVTDHIMLPEENKEAIHRVLEQLVSLSREYGIPLLNGETAYHDNLEGMEISLVMRGQVLKGEEVDYSVEAGDKIIAIESLAINSNGYTRLREELRKDSTSDTVPWKGDLTKPTPLYRRAVEDALRRRHGYISGMSHIAGGGLTRLKDISPDLDFLVYHTDIPLFPVHPLFYWLKERGLSDEEIYETFPVFGYVIFSRPSVAEEIVDTIRKHFRANIVGHVENGDGKVIVESAFTGKEVEI